METFYNQKELRISIQQLEKDIRNYVTTKFVVGKLRYIYAHDYSPIHLSICIFTPETDHSKIYIRIPDIIIEVSEVKDLEFYRKIINQPPFTPMYCPIECKYPYDGYVITFKRVFYDLEMKRIFQT